MEFDLELEKVVERIRREDAKSVCIQLPDGLKPKANEIADVLHGRTGAIVIIWAGSCFGACDESLEVESLGVDLLVQWGHMPWQ